MFIFMFGRESGLPLTGKQKPRRKHRGFAEKEVYESVLHDEGVETIVMQGIDEGAGIEVSSYLEGLAAFLGCVGIGSFGGAYRFSYGFYALSATEVGAAQGKRFDLFVTGSAFAGYGESVVVRFPVVPCLGNRFEGLFDDSLVTTYNDGSRLGVTSCLAAALFDCLGHAFYASFATKVHAGQSHFCFSSH